jgi:heme/copper-type cytochrome/quinol oxidase subunit 2
MLLGALAATVSVSISTEANVPFMENVWTVATKLDSAFWTLMFILLAFAVMLTVLLASLRRRHEQ